MPSPDSSIAKFFPSSTATTPASKLLKSSMREVPLDYIDFVLHRLNEKGYLTEAAP